MAMGVRTMKKYARKCTACKKLFNEGYCIYGGMEYFCSEECMFKHALPEEIADYKAELNNEDSESYWTKWECEEDLQYYEDGSEVEE